jgi:hypothetical protein
MRPCGVSGAATAAASFITRVRIGHGLAPRAAPIAWAIARISIREARAAPRTAPIARTITGVGVGQARAAPRAATIAGAIAGVSIRHARAAPCAAAIAGAIARIGIGQARAARTATSTPWSIARIGIGHNRDHGGLLQRFSGGLPRGTQNGRCGRQMQDEQPTPQGALLGFG